MMPLIDPGHPGAGGKAPEAMEASLWPGRTRGLSVWERPGPTLAIYHGHHGFFMGPSDAVP